MKANLRIKFIELNGHKVNGDLLSREPSIDKSVMVFMQTLGVELKERLLKPRGVIISQPVYIVHHGKNSISGTIHFSIERVQRIKPESLGMGAKIIAQAFKKDLEIIAGQLETHYLSQRIHVKITPKVF